MSQSGMMFIENVGQFSRQGPTGDEKQGHRHGSRDEVSTGVNVAGRVVVNIREAVPRPGVQRVGGQGVGLDEAAQVRVVTWRYSNTTRCCCQTAGR